MNIDLNNTIAQIDYNLIATYKKLMKKNNNYTTTEQAYILGITTATINNNREINWNKVVRIMISLKIPKEDKKEFLRGLNLSPRLLSSIWNSRGGDW